MSNKKLQAARGLLARNPKSKAKALKLYLKDHIGILHNDVTDEMRKELCDALAKFKGRNVPAIKEICRDFVGNVFDGNCAKLIRNCEIIGCWLYNVRPYKPKHKNMGYEDDIMSPNADWED